MAKNSALGDRMKNNYEDITRIKLPRRTFTIIRLDGRSFSKFCKRFKKPFDDDFVRMMNETAKYLCENIQGCKIGFVQSDEISLVLTDFDELSTTPWFDGTIQKIASISASFASTKFLQLLYDYQFSKLENPILYIDQIRKIIMSQKLLEFDSRCYTIGERAEVLNTLLWRQQDCSRNSISMVAQSLYSHKELERKNNSEKQELIFQKGQNWDKYPVGVKRGRVIVRGEDGKWCIVEPPIFSKDWEFLNVIPNYPENSDKIKNFKFEINWKDIRDLPNE